MARSELIEGIFGAYYVMTEQGSLNAEGSSLGSLLCAVLYLVDAGQVIKAMMLPDFGWSASIVSTANKFDFIGLLLDVIPHPYIPTGVLFAISVGLVSIILFNTAFVVRIFQLGMTTNHLWQVMMLRFLLVFMVTTFFVNIFKSILFTLECHPSDSEDDTLSTWLRGEPAPCRPWGTPEIAITAPSLALALLFAAFATLSSLLSFEANPMSEVPGDRFTGRVEALWCLLRVAVVLARHVQHLITAVGALVIVCLLAGGVFAFHASQLPFHSHDFNVLRGGIYAAVLWAAIATAVVASSSGKAEQDGARTQWGLLAAVPIMFFVGMSLLRQTRVRILQNIKRLRGEHTKEAAVAAATATLSSASAAAAAGRSKGVAHRFHKRDQFADFFDTNGKLSRGFESASAASAAIRTLLYEKDERCEPCPPFRDTILFSPPLDQLLCFGHQRVIKPAELNISGCCYRSVCLLWGNADIPFLMYLFHVGMEEHPESRELQILHLIFLRFVFRDEQAAALQEKTTKMTSADLPIDLQYALYAVGRKAYQMDVGLTMGKDSVSAINLMEFSANMTRVRKKHQECITLLKGLWGMAEKSKRDVSMGMAQNLLDKFIRASKAVAHTDTCYEELIDKFSSSVSLRLDYASFCDTVLNDMHKADKLRRGADLLESGADGGMSEDVGDDMRSVSKSNSSTVSHRSAQRNYVNSWSEEVMSTQVRALKQFRFLIFGLGSFLLLFSTCGFVIMEVLLFQSIVETRLSFLHKIVGYRPNVYRASSFLRDLYLMRNDSDPSISEDISSCRARLMDLSKSVLGFHTQNYKNIPTASLSSFFQQPSVTETVYNQDTGIFEVHNVSFWDLGVTFYSAVSDAAQISIPDLRNPSFSLDGMSLSKRAIVYINDNFVTVKRSVDEFVSIVENEIALVQSITSDTAEALLTVSALIICVISYIVLRNVRSVFPTCQHGAVGCALLHSHPLSALRKVHKHYQACDQRIAQIDDEAVAKMSVEQMAGENGRPFEDGTVSSGGSADDGDSYGPAPEVQGAGSAHQLVSPVNMHAHHHAQKTMLGGGGGLGDHNDVDDGRSDEVHINSPAGGRSPPGRRSLSPRGQTRVRPSSRYTWTSDGGGDDDDDHGDGDGGGDSPRELPGSRCQGGRVKALAGQRSQRSLTGGSQRSLVSGSGLHSPSPSGGGSWRPVPLTKENLRLYLEGGGASFRTAAASAADTGSVAAAESPTARRGLTSPVPGSIGIGGVGAGEGHDAGKEWGKGVQESPRRALTWQSSANLSSAVSDDAPRPGLPALPLPSAVDGFVSSQDTTIAASDRRERRRGGGLQGTAGLPSSAEPAARDRMSREGSGAGDEAISERRSSEPSWAVARRWRRLVAAARRRGALQRAASWHHVASATREGCLRRGGQASFRRRQALAAATAHAAASTAAADASASSTAAATIADEHAPGSVSEAVLRTLRRILMRQGAGNTVATGGESGSGQRRWVSTGAAGVRAGYAAVVEDDEAEFAGHLQRATSEGLAWYYRVSFYGWALAAVLALCFCTWLVPLQFVPQLLNVPRLVQQTYGTLGAMLRCVVLLRELVLNDGLIRHSGAEIFELLATSRATMLQALTDVRLGGFKVFVGADNLDDAHFKDYSNIMYQPGCPWRSNSSDCSLESRPLAATRGLYKYLVQFDQSVEAIEGKYGPGSPLFTPEPKYSGFNYVEYNATRANLLDSDEDLRFVLERLAGDGEAGLVALAEVFGEQQTRLLNELHQQSQMLISLFMISVVVVFYVILFRITFAAARSEVVLAKAFVVMIPAHAISREELQHVRDFFVKDPEGGDGDGGGGGGEPEDDIRPAHGRSPATLR